MKKIKIFFGEIKTFIKNVIKAIKSLTIKKVFSNMWVNLAYFTISFIVDIEIRGMGWAFIMLYFFLAAYLTYKVSVDSVSN